MTTLNLRIAQTIISFLVTATWMIQNPTISHPSRTKQLLRVLPVVLSSEQQVKHHRHPKHPVKYCVARKLPAGHYLRLRSVGYCRSPRLHTQGRTHWNQPTSHLSCSKILTGMLIGLSHPIGTCLSLDQPVGLHLSFGTVKCGRLSRALWVIRVQPMARALGGEMRTSPIRWWPTLVRLHGRSR